MPQKAVMIFNNQTGYMMLRGKYNRMSTFIIHECLLNSTTNSKYSNRINKWLKFSKFTRFGQTLFCLNNRNFVEGMSLNLLDNFNFRSF